MATYKAVVSRKKIDTSQIKKIVCEGDLIDQVAFVIPRFEGSTDMSVYDHYLKFVNVNDEGSPELLVPSVKTNTIELTWTISSSFTAVPGVVEIQLYAQDIISGETIMKWQTFPARVEVVSDIAPSTPPTLSDPTILDEYLARYQNVQPNITPNSDTSITGILKGEYGKVAPAISGTDYQPPITIDATPTDGSSNPITSNGVYDALALKANKAQEAWITPTLYNATGIFQYRKNEFGRLEFTGSITPTSTASNTLTFPVGYRPLLEDVFSVAVANDGTIGWIRVRTSGLMYMSSTFANKSVSFGGASIQL